MTIDKHREAAAASIHYQPNIQVCEVLGRLDPFALSPNTAQITQYNKGSMANNSCLQVRF